MISRPHGGRLVDRYVKGTGEIDRITQDASRAPAVTLDARELADVEMIACGAFSPLHGFMNRRDYDAVIADGRLASGLPWTIPITLAMTKDDAWRAGEVGVVALRDPGGLLIAALRVDDVYQSDAAREAEQVYRTSDPSHPGVAYLFARERWRVGGVLDVVRRPAHPDFERVLLEPKETRVLFHAKGWKTVVAFQTRNPIHRAHEYMQKCALEIVDGLFVHPLVGATKDDDVPAEVRLRCYRALLATHFPPARTVLSVFPAAMRYAGPREAILHALVRKNYGCTHIIIGRDHAGVGNFYGSFDAQRIFADFSADELGITPLFFDHTFYCAGCEGMASAKTCPHEADARVTLSGTAVRQLLESGALPPREYTRPEVAAILVDEYTTRPRASQAVEVLA